MLFATWSQASSFLVPAVFGYGLLAVLFWAAGRTATVTRGVERAAMRVVQAVLVTVAVFGAPYTLIGVAAISCAPDAYECPV